VEKTTQERNERARKAAAYTKAVQDIQDMWNETYTIATHQASTASTSAKGFAKAQLDRNVRLYAKMKDNPPRCDLEVMALNTRSEVEDSMTKPVFYLPISERMGVWSEAMWSKDNIASLLGNPAISWTSGKLFENQLVDLY
jgi:hypothetical protein